MGSPGWSVAQEAKLNSFSAWCFDKLDRPFPQGAPCLTRTWTQVQKSRGKKLGHRNFVGCASKKSEHKNFMGCADRVLARAREGGQGAGAGYPEVNTVNFWFPEVDSVNHP